MAYPLTALISDLHGNVQALEVALADAAERGAERVVCLGDVVGYGARPVACLDLLMGLTGEDPRDATGRPLAQGFCLLGNHEQALLQSPEDFNPRARVAIEWTRDAIQSEGGQHAAADYWNWIGGLQSRWTDERALYVHGSPRDPVKEYVLPSDALRPEKMDALFDCMERPLSFVGHSHVPAVYYSDRRLYRPRDTEGPYRIGAGSDLKVIINVGSVGQPRDGDARLSYGLFDGDNITFVRLAYDIAGAQDDIRATGTLPDHLAERLASGR